MEFGTPNMLGVASLWAGQEWLEQQGLENIYGHEMRLARKLVEGVRFYCCDSMKDHLSTFILNIDGMDAGDVGIMLDVDHNIATRTGLHCAPLVHTQLGTVDSHGGVRFSIGAFNTEEQINTAIGAVAAIARWSAGRKR